MQMQSQQQILQSNTSPFMMHRDISPMLALTVPTEFEPRLDDFKHGSVEFAMASHGGLDMLFIKFGKDGCWTSLPHHVGMYPPAKRGPVKSWKKGHPLTFTVFIGTERSDFVQAVRQLSLPPDFAAHLMSTMKRQAKTALTFFDFVRLIDESLTVYPTPQDMLAVATPRCVVA
jgi:hypothetical protein